ncbi:MAG: outer membrane lipid asymmetry maintenance protein MlaD [Gammaproteobacteria bacterium]|nr:outer membrane lipid asymmetry maintenance protein MlaD [Gammaproteobacteria bacterium]
MRTRTIEIMVGAFVAAGIAALFMLAMKASNLGTASIRDGYQVTARFDNIGGLRVQAPVSAGGVRVGRVTAITYDQEDYEARVHMTIDSRYDRFPSDTSASIYTAGLLGEQYIGLEPGGADDFLADGDAILLTQSALVLEQLIGRFLFAMTEGKDG